MSHAPTIASEGIVTATITGSHNHAFTADAHRQHIFKTGENWYISSVQLMSSNPNQNYYGLRLKLPSDFKDDGNEYSYTFADQASGYFYAPFRDAGITVFDITEGQIRVSLKNETMKATFAFKATYQALAVDVNEGTVDLTGISYPRHDAGTFHATFTNSPFPNSEFNATFVEIQSQEGPIVPESWQVYSEQPIDSIPPATSRITIQIEKSLTEKTYDLSKTEQVRVFCSSLPLIHTHLATSGTLTFSSLPGTGHAQGHFACEFAVPGKEPFSAIAEFDVTGPTLHYSTLPTP